MQGAAVDCERKPGRLGFPVFEACEEDLHPVGPSASPKAFGCLVLAHNNKIYKSDSTNECKQIIRVFRLLRKRTSKATTALAHQVSFAARIR